MSTLALHNMRSLGSQCPPDKSTKQKKEQRTTTTTTTTIINNANKMPKQNPKRGTYRAAAEISLTWTKTFLSGVLGKNPNYSTLCSNIPADEESQKTRRSHENY
jgi:hypothetical protein